MFGIIFGVVFLVWLYQLNAKVSTLTQDVKDLKQGRTSSTPNPVSSPTVDVSGFGMESQTVTPVAVQQASAYVPAQEPSEGAFSKWIKEDFFVKLGALLLLIGFGWFVSYAFAHQWIGPMGRISLGMVSGIAIMTFGAWRIRKFIHQGSIFLVLGSTVILLTVFAARELYDFFTPTTAMGMMFLSVAFVAYVSVVYKNERLALASLILAGVAPLLTNTPNPDIVGLFTYLLVVVLGTLWVVRLTGSSALTFAALLIVALYGVPYAADITGSYTDRDIALLFAFLFTAVFFIGNTVSMIREEKSSVLQTHLITAFGTGMYLTCWIFAAAQKEFQSLLFSAWMLVFALGSFVVYRRFQQTAPFYIYSAISVGLLAAATAAELDGPLLTIAYTIEAGLVVLLASILTANARIVQNSSMLFAVPVVLSFASMASVAWVDGFLHKDFFVLVVLALTLIGTGAELLQRNMRELTQLAHLYTVGGVLYVLVLIWLVLHSVLVQDFATMISLVIYSVIGLALFISGRIQDRKTTKTSGAVLLGFVVAHLILIDVWQMELAGRIITFFVVGVLLISTAFIRQSHTREHLSETNPS